MLQNKTIQMDADLIANIQKIMVQENNFSFQAVTRNVIKIGLETLEKRQGVSNGHEQKRNL